MICITGIIIIATIKTMAPDLEFSERKSHTLSIHKGAIFKRDFFF